MGPRDASTEALEHRRKERKPEHEGALESGLGATTRIRAGPGRAHGTQGDGRERAEGRVHGGGEREKQGASRERNERPSWVSRGARTASAMEMAGPGKANSKLGRAAGTAGGEADCARLPEERAGAAASTETRGRGRAVGKGAERAWASSGRSDERHGRLGKKGASAGESEQKGETRRKTNCIR
jgi:hypothetical protein